MAQYLSPGVFVEEVPSGIAPIAGVGTSTAGFVGAVKYSEVEPNLELLLGRVLQAVAFPKGLAITEDNVQVIIDAVGALEMGTVEVSGSLPATAVDLVGMKLLRAVVVGKVTMPVNTLITDEVKAAIIEAAGDEEEAGKVKLKVSGPRKPEQDRLENMTLAQDVVVPTNPIDGKPFFEFAETPDGKMNEVMVGKVVAKLGRGGIKVRLEPKTPPGEAKQITSYSEFVSFFGDFAKDNERQDHLSHAVYGFFDNGGTLCYVTRVDEPVDDEGKPIKDKDDPDKKLAAGLDTFKEIDEIALVAIPGTLDATTQAAIVSHCENLGDRFAILDGNRLVKDDNKTVDSIQGELSDSNYAAMYWPWIDIGQKDKDGNPKYYPPSGHVAGLYARVDTARGVHKAPANENIRGAKGVEHRVNKALHGLLNPDGINVIRKFDTDIKVYGARTLGGDANTEFKYINVRRLFLFLRESIDEGTQWVVFEPNTQDLWQKITRNISAFLNLVWRTGAFFGATPQESFYVKCDSETNPPEVRDAGQVVTEIGVAPAKPAEFVIFRISQWAGPGS